MTANTVLRTALGPKEGRLPPAQFSPILIEQRRRLNSRIKHAFIFSTVLIVFLIYFCLQRDRLEPWEESSYGPRNDPLLRNQKSAASWAGTYRNDWRSRFNSRKSVQTPMLGQIMMDEEQPTTKEPIVRNPVPEITKTQDTYHHRQKPELEMERETPHSNHWSERPSLKNDLEAIFALQPDEMNTRELLRPIKDGGAERMRELGLRTRAYGRYLAAWEKLHLAENKKTGEMSVRDDVIQYLRSVQEDEGASVGSSLTNTIHDYEAFRAFLVKFARLLFPFTSPYFADHMALHAQFKNAGRGIVLTAGDDQAKYLLTTIYTFRELGCDLPIEIMYLGDEDLGEDHRFELEALPGVTTRDISQMVDDEGWKLAGWAIKPFAMLMSSFREVIFIDADSFFFRDPAKLFDDPDYKRTGALFFRDRTIMPESKRRWLLQILPRPIHKLAKESSWWTGSSGHHQESGVVVVDKWKHFVSMLLICRFNGSDRDPRAGKVGVYEMMHGDKETFWIGFLLAGDPSFAFHRGAVGSIGVLEPPNATTGPPNSDASASPLATMTPDKPRGDDEAGATEPATYTICSPQLLHLDVDGTPLWFNGWLLVSKYAERPKRRFAPMTAYLREPRHKAIDDDFWKLTTDNMCCLTSDAASRADLDARDLALLKMMRERAEAVGVMN